jgi:hypothetical protein
MRSVAWVVVVALLISSSAQGKGTKRQDWAAAESLKWGATIRVATRTGERIEGYARAVSADTLKLDATEPGSGIVINFGRTIARNDVEKLYTAPLTIDRPRRLSRKELLLGSATGVAIGVGVGAIYDAKHPYSDDPGLGKAVFGLLGALMGPAVAVAGRGLARLGHRPVLVYEAARP